MSNTKEKAKELCEKSPCHKQSEGEWIVDAWDGAE